MAGLSLRRRLSIISVFSGCSVFTGAGDRDGNGVRKHNQESGLRGWNEDTAENVKIGNCFMCAPDGISIMAHDAAAFEIQLVFKGQPVW